MGSFMVLSCRQESNLGTWSFGDGKDKGHDLGFKKVSIREKKCPNALNALGVLSRGLGGEISF